MGQRRLVAGDQALARFFRSEGLVDNGEDGGRRTKREIQRHAGEGLHPLTVPTLEVAPHLRELFRLRSLEREDRLLLVADSKHRATVRPRALAGEELLGQLLDDAPLLRRVVLRLVDQEMVEPVVELVHDPSGARPGDERERARDLVGEVERAALSLGRGEAFQDCSGHDEEGLAALERLGGAATLAQRNESDELALQIRFEAGLLVAQFRAGQMAFYASTRFALAVLGEEGVEQRLHPSGNVYRRIGRMKPGGERFVVGLADGEPLRPRPPMSPPNVAAKHLGLDARRRHAHREAEPASKRLAKARHVVEAIQGFRKILRLLEQLVEIERPGVSRDPVERRLALG